LDHLGTVIATTTTSPDGSYSFPNLVPGMYSVRETDLPGYVSTTPNLVPVTLAPGGSATVNFGDVQLPDLSIEKTLQGVLTTGQGGTYLIQVTNVGNGPTAGPITVMDPMPAGLTLVSADGSNWDCTNSTPQNMECSFAPILLGHQSAPLITLRVTVQSSPGSVIRNVATVSTAFDTGANNNSGAASAPVVQTAPVPLLSAQGVLAMIAVLLFVAALGVRQLRAGSSHTRRTRL
jgi:uncharacterized repeat protein (TIGR01451 family)